MLDRRKIATTQDAEELMERVFDAWNARDIKEMLGYFTDDLVFVEHAAGGGSSYKVRHGAPEFGDYLQSYLDVADCVSALRHITYDGIHIRTVIGFTVRHRRKQMTLEGRFRQVIRLRDGLISHLDEYHDVDASSSYWNLTRDD